MPTTATSRPRSPRESALRLILTTSITLLVAAPPSSAVPRDPLYQWSDAAGAVRYTTDFERIPVDRRDAAVVVAVEHDRGRAAAQPASQPAALPQSIAAPSASQLAASPESIAAPPVEPPPTAEPQPDDTPALPPVEAQPPLAAPVSEEVAALDARIAELERSIAADETALGDYISDLERAARQRESGEVAAIAERLPRLQDELRELRKQREAAIAPDGP